MCYIEHQRKRRYAWCLFLGYIALAVILVVLFVQSLFAGTIVIHHAGGELVCTLAAPGIIWSPAMTMSVNCAENYTVTQPPPPPVGVLDILCYRTCLSRGEIETICRQRCTH